MLNYLDRLIKGFVIRSNRRALQGRTCPHAKVVFTREPGEWSEPKPHPHPLFRNKVKIRTRETRELCRCEVCGVNILDRLVSDVVDSRDGDINNA